MAIGYDNRPNLNNKQFDQATGDTLNLCGSTSIVGVCGKINSNNGYQISGSTIINARGVGTPSAIQIGLNANSQGTNSTAIGFGTKAFGSSSVAIGCGNVMSANTSTIIGGNNNIVSCGNTNATFLGFNGCTIPVNSYCDSVVVPNLKILSIPAGSGNFLCYDNATKSICRTSGGGTNYWSSGATGLSPAAGEDILLPNTDKLKWADGSCITSNASVMTVGASTANICGTSVRLCEGTQQLLLTAGYTLLQSNTIYLGGIAAGIIETNTSTKCVQLYGGGCYVMKLCGGGSSSASAAGDVQLCGGNNTSTGNAGTIIISGGINSGGGSNGRVRLCNLPSCTIETCVVFIDASGNLSKGVAAGGGTALGWSNLTNGSTVVGCGTIASGNSTCNTFYGVEAGKSVTTGSGNVAIGVKALCLNIIGTNNVAVGALALVKSTGSQSTAVGAAALTCNTTGYDNTGIGQGALRANNTGYENTSVGSFSLFSNTSGFYNVGIGAQVLYNNLTGHGNVGIGQRTLYTNNSGCDNIAIGVAALCKNTTGCLNIAIGCEALTCNTTGSYNIGLGYAALCSNTGGTNNIAIGCATLQKNTNAQYNVGIGSTALCDNTSGFQNVAISTSMRKNTSGNCNVGIGWVALDVNTTGHNNTAVGASALSANISGCNNVAIGYALAGNTIGNSNIGIGNTAGGVTSGSNNIIIGDYAGLSLAGASNSVIIGSNAGRESSGSANVIIGRYAGYYEASSCKLHIANCHTCSLIYGDFAAQTICNGANSASWNTTSDCRIKECVCTIPDALSTLCALNPVFFNYTTGYTAKAGFNENIRVGNYGFLAQEFETVFPKYVKCSEDAISCVSGSTVSDFRTIDTGHLVPLLVKAIHEQQAQINELCQKLVNCGLI